MAVMIQRLLMLALLCVTADAFNVTYEGYQLISVTPQTDVQVFLITQLFEDNVEVDVWKYPKLMESAFALVPPHDLSYIKERLSFFEVEWKVVNKDVNDLVSSLDHFAETDPSYREEQEEAEGEDLVDHSKFHDLAAIERYLRLFRREYPKQTEVLDLPYITFEGRTVKVIKLGSNVNRRLNTKRSIVIEGTIHAREWISTSSILYFIDKVLQQHRNGESPGYQMLRRYDWYIVPVANPDGYVYTAKDRFWRKNRRVMRGCVGVDVNRNFGYQFGTTGISWNCRSIIYPGFHAFSEPEAQNMKFLFQRVNLSARSYMSVHAFAQAVLIPWFHSNTSEVPVHYKKLAFVAKKMTMAIKDTTGYDYQIGTVKDIFQYSASGSSADWSLMEKPGLYAFSIEMRPDYKMIRNDEGFALPPSSIVPAGKELFASFQMLAEGIQWLGD